MPIVPRLSGPQVQQAAIPNARSRVQVSEETFGGGQSLAAATQAAQGLLGQANKLVMEEKQKADDVRVKDALADLVRRRQDKTFNPETGALSRKGQNAFNVVDEYGTAFDKDIGEIEERLSPAQRSTFHQLAQQQKVDFMGDLERHTLKEHTEYGEQVNQKLLAATRDEATLYFSDPVKVSASLAKQRGLIIDQGAKAGKAPEVVQQEIAEAAAQTHSGVLDRIISSGDDKAALAYFNANAPGFGRFAAHAEKSLEEATLRGESQRQSDAIIAKASGMSEALASARGIEDPKIRDAATDRIKSYFAAKKAADSEREERIMTDAGNIIDQTGDYNKIPPSQLALLSPSQKSSLMSYAEKKRDGSLATDWEAYHDLKLMAASPALRGKFIQTNLMEYRGKMADAQFKELVETKASLMAKDGKAEERLDGYRTNAQIVGDTLAAAEIKDPAQVALFHSKVDEELARLQKQTGKHATNEDVQRITDGLVVQGVTSRSFFGLWKNKKRKFETTGEDREFEVEARDIPRIERQKIEEALRRRGMPVNDDTVKALYDRKLSSKATRYAGP